ncbi:hypothetical protein SAMN05444411_102374 [Lutibacter oricola]|uniref:SpoIIAA-like n=1 Tax=Lutibacter oricola TaxID=762486 RepID=A0A1H2X5U4_9FLAO|nr:hypothetical protein [Lutibacter oricola]SDW88147.1 hypothetical protein SAMN05444411_102374 [Lutibacter oricola]
MNNTIKCTYNSKNKIFIKSYHGDIYLEDVVNSWKEIISKKIIPENFQGIIVDLRKGVIKMTIEESVGVSQFYKNNLSLFGNKKIAYITNSPIKTVYSMLVEQKDKGYKTKTFSYKEAAIYWILN